MRLRSLLTAVALAWLSPLARADELPPADKAIEAVIDQTIDAALSDAGVTPASQADDATLVRRLTLDLVGRIPTAGEVDAYVKSADPAKRAKLVDRLIASPGFVRHQAALFEVMLAPENNRRGGAGLRHDRGEPLLGDAQEAVRVPGGAHGVDRDLHVAVGAVLEADRHR